MCRQIRGYGTRSVPTTDPVGRDQAEIADHLATSAERLQAQGIAQTEAQPESQEKFGDPQTISRRCYWIKQGDALMFRTAVIALLRSSAWPSANGSSPRYRGQRKWPSRWPCWPSN